MVEKFVAPAPRAIQEARGDKARMRTGMGKTTTPTDHTASVITAGAGAGERSLARSPHYNSPYRSHDDYLEDSPYKGSQSPDHSEDSDTFKTIM